MSKGGRIVWMMAGMSSFVLQLGLGGLFRTEVKYARVVSTAGQIPFEGSIRAPHWLGGLLQGEQPDLNKVLATLTRDRGPIRSLEVRVRHSAADNLIAAVTLFVYTPVTVEVRGTIERGTAK
jgi:hypothetical protein